MPPTVPECRRSSWQAHAAVDRRFASLRRPSPSDCAGGTDAGRTKPVAAPAGQAVIAGQGAGGPGPEAFCKTVGTAYDGSNPSPDTTCEDAPDLRIRRSGVPPETGVRYPTSSRASP